MVNIPVFQVDGVLILLGGSNTPHLLAFNIITIYDKATQKWYSQPALEALQSLGIILAL